MTRKILSLKQLVWSIISPHWHHLKIGRTQIIHEYFPPNTHFFEQLKKQILVQFNQYLIPIMYYV